MTGISEQDLLDHKSEDGAHTARSISVENTFVNIAGTDLQTAIEAIDAQLNMRTSVIGDETAAREAADTALDGRVDTLETTATKNRGQASRIGDRQVNCLFCQYLLACPLNLSPKFLNSVFLPTKPFESIEAARDWVRAFVIWYNTEQLHSGINFVTPASKHTGADVKILSQREKVYAEAKTKNPARWSGTTRNWKPIKEVKLNWLKEDQINPNVLSTQLAA